MDEPRNQKPKRNIPLKDANCYRCGAELRQRYFLEPIICGTCRNTLQFLERHPGVADTVDWFYPPAKPGYVAPDATPVQEAAAAALAARAEPTDADRVRSHLSALQSARTEIYEERATSERLRRECAETVSVLTEKLSQCDRAIARLIAENPDVFAE